MTNEDIFHLNLALAKKTDFGKIEQPVNKAEQSKEDCEAKLLRDCKAYMLAQSSVIDAIYPTMKQEPAPSNLPKNVRDALYPTKVETSTDYEKQIPKQNTQYNPLDVQKEILKQFGLAEAINKIKADENVRISHAMFGDSFFYRRKDGEYMTNIGSPAEHIHNKISVAQYQNWKELDDNFYEYRESLINQAQAWFHTVNNTAPTVKGNTKNEKWF
jgi:hypothetical protein